MQRKQQAKTTRRRSKRGKQEQKLLERIHLNAAFPGLMAESGYWYDAVSALSELREAHPENRDVEAAFDTLLEQGEIEGPALEGTTETDPR